MNGRPLKSGRTGNVVTLCSVSFNSGDYLRLNWALTHHLNPDLDWQWLVVENTPPGGSGRLPNNDPRFLVRSELDAPIKGTRAAASYQHGLALNAALASVQTRFVVILDPDFYVLRPRWLRDVISHMRERDLAFFGAPWHVRWHRKYRGFPCSHFMVIDLEKVSRSEIDFEPDLADDEMKPTREIWKRYYLLKSHGRNAGAIAWLMFHARKSLREDRDQRLRIGTSRDAGWRIYERFAEIPGFGSEVVEPVFQRGIDRIPGVSQLQILPLVERFWPENRRYLPGGGTYYNEKGFREHGLADIKGRGWEEFVWQGQPFGFHVRNQMQKPGTVAVKAVAKALEDLTGQRLVAALERTSAEAQRGRPERYE